ncbi:hypothetical protein PSEUBRA_004471 [Kalmanozyma brasiliensis GHG001]|uniref:uncharacterized protein n=1 Tax=Kalmanozyma brasiliensis (strain GHG001) TaxID=1365824 RepID=UPI0028682075|nr:uncharacterized protein PSEUBRA_004471 [Kalmanozyma brasiliensis GHG001]KAF6767385.1 hypothetical protein PSEUBRA_004471 [Kalmanozyma brasiliensis GHG001]
MQVTSGSGHQRPWWLAFGLLAFLFVSNFASAASVSQVVRRGSEWTEHPSLPYAGEGFALHKGPRGPQILVHRFLPYDDIAVIPNTIQSFRAEEQKQIFKAIPALKPLQKNGWSWNRLADKPVVGQHFDDPAGIYTLPNRKPHTVRVRSKGGRFEFNYLGKSALGLETRKWSPFEELPEHMQKFLRRYAQSDRSVPWMSVLRSSVRKRSLDEAAELHKRAPGQAETTISYPGKKFIVTRVSNDPRTPYRISVLTEDARNIVGTSKWSDLPSSLQTRLSRQVPNLGVFASSNAPASDASRWQIKLGSHAFDDEAVYAHPDYPPELLQVVRLPSGKVVFQRNFGQMLKFSQLPQHLRAYMESQPSLRGMLADAIETTTRTGLPQRGARFFKRAPPEYLQTVQYPGKKVVITRDPNDPLTSYRLNFLNEDARSLSDYRKWSQLSESLQSRLFQQAPNMGTFASSHLPESEASRLDVKLGSHLFDTENAYVHPEFPPETIQVLRKSSGKVVFSRASGELVKFSQLPGHLRSYLRSQPGIEAILADAGRTTKKFGFPLRSFRFFKRAPLETLHTVEYVHAGFPAETIQILRKSSGKIVFQRGSENAVKFAELPAHLKAYLHSQPALSGALAEATRGTNKQGFSHNTARGFRFFKRAPPTPTMDHPLHTIPYHGERITLTQGRDGKYVFNFVRLRSDGVPDKLYRTTRWSALPSEIRQHFEGIPGVKIVAKSTMSPGYARTLPVMVADEPFDLTQAFHHPERKAETISVWPTDQGIMFQRQTATRVHGLQPLESLPEHLQTYLRAEPSLQNVLGWGRRLP